MSHIWERSEVHKSSKCIEHVVTLFSDYCQAVTTLANLQKKLSRALKDVATVKGTGMVPANAMQASSALFEALGEVDGKLAKLAEKEYDHLSAEVRKHFKKMAKEEKAHDELTFNTNVRLKQASSSYDKKVKGKVPYTAEEHAKHVHLLSTLGNEMAAAKLSHETHISQRHVGILFAVGASLSRVADACWIGSCEHVKRAGPLIGRIGQWKSLCEGGWAGAVPEDLPDIDKPGSGVIDRAGLGGSPRKDKYSASLTETMTGSTSRSPPLISPFPVTPIPGMGPLNAAAGYFASMGENGDLKPPIAPFSREGMAISNQGSGHSSPGLPYSSAPPPFSTPVPPATPKRKDSQFPPPPQHPASPTRPHAGLPPPSPVRSNVGLPNQAIDGLPPSTPVRAFADLSDSKGSPIRAPASPIRGPSSPFRPPGSPARVPSSPTRGPLPPPPNPEAASDSTTPITHQLIDLSPGTPSPSPKKAGWGTNSWAPIGGGENGGQPPAGEPEPEQTVSISRFLSENKEMGIDVTELEGAAIRENVERMAAAAAAGGASLTDTQPVDTKPLAIGGGNGWGNGSQYELGPTGTVKKLVLDEDRRQISGGPRPLPDSGSTRPLPMPADAKNPTRKRTGSIESFTSNGATSRVAAIRSKYDNPPQSPGPRDRPPLSHAVTDMMNAARSPEGPPPTNRGWIRSNPPPSAYPERSGLVSPSLDNIHSSNAGMDWSTREFNHLREQREREWKAREYALSLDQRELELERQRIMLHQQYQQFTGSSSSSTALSGTTGVRSSTSASGTTSTSGTSNATGMSGSTTLSGATTILGHPAFGRRPRTPESIPDDTPPPWVSSGKASNARYRTQLRDESDNESTSPSGKKSTWVGRGLRRLSMPSPFAEKKPIQVVSIPAPREPGIGNRRSFDAGR
ncbi:unnamed protein product [Rhizoctonia solani]|uniref:Uncharacterized protein n=1 Tax=Rhizoctonia solani TaxID=456999 RepID=A0A8H3HL84_9AGAM|nr:unnamed protein product [Rhizoctonia solani]